MSIRQRSCMKEDEHYVAKMKHICLPLDVLVILAYAGYVVKDG